MIIVQGYNTVAVKELFFSETNSHFFLIFPYCTKILFFRYPWALPIFVCKNYANIMTYSIFMRNFVKKWYFSNKCPIYRKTGFWLTRNWCEISCKKSHLMQEHETLAQKNLLFRGNPTPPPFLSIFIWFMYILTTPLGGALNSIDNWFMSPGNKIWWGGIG